MNKRIAISLLATIATVLVVVMASVFGAPAKPAGADNVVGTRSSTFISSVGGVSTTVNGDAVYTQLFGQVDCFSTYVSTSNPAAGQTMTVKLQNSADGTNWADNLNLAQQVGAGTVMTRAPALGAYMRAVATVASVQPLTFTVKCTLKNLQ